MDKDTVIVFTRNGMGEAPSELQGNLVVKFLTLLHENQQLPGKIVFYTDGVKLICRGSPAVDILKKIEAQGVELVIAIPAEFLWTSGSGGSRCGRWNG